MTYTFIEQTFLAVHGLFLVGDAVETSHRLWYDVVCLQSHDYEFQFFMNPLSANPTKWLKSAVSDEWFEGVWPFCGVGV